MTSGGECPSWCGASLLPPGLDPVALGLIFLVETPDSAPRPNPTHRPQLRPLVKTVSTRSMQHARPPPLCHPPTPVHCSVRVGALPASQTADRRRPGHRRRHLCLCQHRSCQPRGACTKATCPQTSLCGLVVLVLLVLTGVVGCVGGVGVVGCVGGCHSCCCWWRVGGVALTLT